MSKKAEYRYDNIVFLDLEVGKDDGKIYEIGMLYKDRVHNTPGIQETENFLKLCNAKYLCGHNFIDFDYEVLKDTSLYYDFSTYKMIDTLPLSLLVFNEKSVHALPKEYKQEDDFRNDPVEDCKITAKLLWNIEEKFMILDDELKQIFYLLLAKEKHYEGFFDYISNRFVFSNESNIYELIVEYYQKVIFNLSYLQEVIHTHPVELAYILALMTPHIETKSHPPRILYMYPEIVKIQQKLCFDLKKTSKQLEYISKEIFGFGSFRIFPKLNPTIWSGQISQKDIVQAALKDESFIAVLPTGGGKTFTFWLPAIIKAKSYKALTVVISPLQALIEDHITSFNRKVANYKAVAISGYMSPLERSEAIEQVVNGEADILYLAPESLRSNMIFNILKNRFIERFVVDEAHCLSTWGNDFRQDYYYICEYINDLLEAKNFQTHIPISCFTATAKPSVIEDIKTYFKGGLNIELERYIAKPERKNLRYKAIPSETKDKYTALLKLINEHDGATLVYIPSSTKECDRVAEQLKMDTGKEVRSFHSKLDSQEKMSILEKYIYNDIDVIVATTAFGMGVDKPDITNVIHYEVSDSLENYAQEAGRGARDEKLNAFCPILFNENDLDKHFATLNRTKITASEINAIFRVIKKRKGDTVYMTAFELAEQAGWDVEDENSDYATKVKTALLELEREGYISRKRNKTSFFADSVAALSMEKLHLKIKEYPYSEEEIKLLTLVLQHILRRGREKSVQVDELAYLLGSSKASIALAIQQLKQMKILGQSKDLSANIFKDSLSRFSKLADIEKELMSYLAVQHGDHITIKELNEHLHECGLIKKNEAILIKDILRNQRNKSLFLFRRINRQNDIWYFKIIDHEGAKTHLYQTHAIAKTIIEHFSKALGNKEKEKVVEFSLEELSTLLSDKFTLKQIDSALLFLHHLKLIELLNGRFISYSPMQIDKEEKMKIQNKRYTKVDYKHRLQNHYQTKTEAIHIMGEYGKYLQSDAERAGRFLRDYFKMDYDAFKKKYQLIKAKISRPITQHRYNKIFSQLSEEQKAIIEDKDTKAMMILAGPGSGKTKVLVHKIASLILAEDIKPEQFMMLTFSRTAAGEFRQRLHQLIGTLSYDIEIHTFHAYALKLIARMVKNEDSDILQEAIVEATEQIKNGDISLPMISVLVLDEYQDINESSFAFVKSIYEANNREMRIIAVGDDDQCIMGHIGADVSYIDMFEKTYGYDEDGKQSFRQYELLTNFRSAKNIVAYSNTFIQRLGKRYKHHALIANKKEEGHVSVITCVSSTLVPPAVERVQREECLQDIAILAYTNDEVMQIYSHLDKIGIGAKYILEREGFSLKNIVELYRFDQELSKLVGYDTHYHEKHFLHAFEVIEKEFKGSKNLPLLQKIIDSFLGENEVYYISQWLAYLDEIKLENFENYQKTVTVSTIHKSKGMEFDKVFLLINDNPKNDEEIRLYYVGMTRAKNELTIFRHGKQQFVRTGSVAKYIYNDKKYEQESKTATLIMGLSDIQLGFKDRYTTQKNKFVAGEHVTLEMRGKAQTFALIFDNRVIGFVSKKFHKELMSYFEKGYKLKSAMIEYVIIWFDKENNQEHTHPLCKINLYKA